MSKYLCVKCDREMKPAITKTVGTELRAVGWFPCACDRPIQTDYGTVYPGDEEHDRLLLSGDYSINDVLNPV
jgi:hypothetical protein